MELEALIDEYKKLGIGICAISRDSREILNKFAEKKNITFPLLADVDFSVIKAFDILNHNVPRDNPTFGIPFPVQYIVDPDGIVREKIFTDNYRERVTQESVLIRHFDWKPGTSAGMIETNELVLNSWASQDVVRPGIHITLLLDIALKDKMHVYAPEVEGYIPVSLELKPSPYYKGSAAIFPKAEILKLEAIGEEQPVYNGSFKIIQEVTIAGGNVLMKGVDESSPPPGELVIEGTFGYQACDDRQCYIPRQIPFKFMFSIENHDWELTIPRE